MSFNLKALMNSAVFQQIPTRITDVQQFIDIMIPYCDFLDVTTDGYNVFIKTIAEDENSGISEINIDPTIFNPDYDFPTFIFTDGTVELEPCNQNQILFLMLHYRFEQFKEMKNPWLNLITKDIKGIMRYIQYMIPSSYNSKQKNKYLTVFVKFSNMYELNDEFSEVFFKSSITESMWKTILQNSNMVVSSIGGMSRSNSIVIKPEELTGTQIYRSVGFKESEKGFVSVFPPKQNVPARLQTHLLGNCYPLSNPATSVFQQDNVISRDADNNRLMVMKDKCLRKAITVFSPINPDTNHLAGGEIDIGNTIAEELLKVNNNLEDCFSELNVVEGKTYYPNFRDFTLGVSLTGQFIILKNFKEFTVESITITGINSSKKIKITGYKHAGNCRITSNTGLKGVTKVVNNLGKIAFKSKPESKVPDCVASCVDESLQARYPNLELDSLHEFPKVVHQQSLVIDAELVCGMNSVKAKSNTIVLGRAALAVELGYYTPAIKHGFEGLLDSLNEAEINEASQSLPEFVYTNKDGVEVKVEVGLVYISYTEICDVYTKIKPQSFSFESGRALALNGPKSKAVYDYIWDNYLETEKVEASVELYKVLTLHQTGVFNNDEDLPVYDLAGINNLFGQNDLVLTKRNQFSSDSLLLDPDFNPKGFFIDLSKYPGGPVIRIPSAKTLKVFSGVLSNGDVIYHVNLINVSKIIKGCLRTNGNYALNTVYSKDKTRTTSALSYNAYINTVRSTIYSGEETSQQMIQSLVKPKVMGCSLKQVHEHLLPDNTVVITDDKMYRKMKQISLSGSEKTIEEHEVKLMIMANLSELSTREEKIAMFEELNKDSPLALTIRSPSLWLTQNNCVQIWDRHMYDLYLSINYGYGIERALNTKFNRDLILISTNNMIMQHSD